MSAGRRMGRWVGRSTWSRIEDSWFFDAKGKALGTRLVCWLAPWLVYLLTHSLTHSLFCSFVHLFVLRSCERPSVRLFNQPLGSWSKLRRQRERERYKTKGLMSGIITLHVCFKYWYISWPFSVKQREMTKFCVFWRTWTATAIFTYFYLELGVFLTHSAGASSLITIPVELWRRFISNVCNDDSVWT